MKDLGGRVQQIVNLVYHLSVSCWLSLQIQSYFSNTLPFRIAENVLKNVSLVVIRSLWLEVREFLQARIY